MRRQGAGGSKEMESGREEFRNRDEGHVNLFPFLFSFSFFEGKREVNEERTRGAGATYAVPLFSAAASALEAVARSFVAQMSRFEYVVEI